MFKKKNKSFQPSKILDGRKYRLAIISIFVLLGGFGLAGINPAFATVYAELVTAILGINALYFGGNVGNKWVIGKAGGLFLGTNSINSESEAKPNGAISKRGNNNPE